MDTGGSVLAEALRRARYEVIPLAGVEESVCTHLPPGTPLTVTAAESHGITATVDLAARLARSGYDVAPHLAARLIADRAELKDILQQLREEGIHDVVVVGGDAAEPAGEFFDARALLVAIDELGHDFESVGIAGYPEGHPAIDDAKLVQALRDKAPYATYLVTQLCFAPAVISRWAADVRRLGVTLPIQVGIPGPVDRQKLIRIAGRIGLGRSARFLTHQRGLVARFFLPGGYRPKRLVRGLAAQVTDPSSSIVGFHVFTFNDLSNVTGWTAGVAHDLA